MQTALSRQRTAMMLVPEIALTPVFSRRLRAHPVISSNLPLSYPEASGLMNGPELRTDWPAL